MTDRRAALLTAAVLLAAFAVVVAVGAVALGLVAGWVGLLIAFAAVALAFSEGFTGDTTARQLRGDTLALAAGTLWGLTTLVIRGSSLAKASAEKTLFYPVAVTAVVAPAR